VVTERWELGECPSAERQMRGEGELRKRVTCACHFGIASAHFLQV
jgi:hypothetical protein